MLTVLPSDENIACTGRIGMSDKHKYLFTWWALPSVLSCGGGDRAGLTADRVNLLLKKDGETAARS